MTFGEKLKELRKKKKMTQEEVANEIGISRRSYIAYEQESIRPRRQETYEKLAKTLGCDVNYLRVEDTVGYKVPLAAVSAMGVALGAMGVAAPISSGMIAAFTSMLTYLGIKAVKKTGKPDDTTVPLKSLQDAVQQYERIQKQFAAIAMGILLKAAAGKGILCHHGDMSDLEPSGGYPDEYMQVSNQKISSWWLVFWAKDSDFSGPIKDQAGALLSRFAIARGDPKRMASIIVDDSELYDQIYRYKENNSYRGNLSVVLVDTKEVTVVKEALISSYYEDRTDQNTFLSVM